MNISERLKNLFPKDPVTGDTRVARNVVIGLVVAGMLIMLVVFVIF